MATAWCPLSTTKPPLDTTVLVANYEMQVTAHLDDEGDWVTESHFRLQWEPTHWRPLDTLPEPPPLLSDAELRGIYAKWRRDADVDDVDGESIALFRRIIEAHETKRKAQEKA